MAAVRQIHMYSPDPATRDAFIENCKTYPAPSKGLGFVSSPEQLVIVYDCFLTDNSALYKLPNPILVIHTPHQCISKFTKTE